MGARAEYSSVPVNLVSAAGERLGGTVVNPESSATVSVPAGAFSVVVNVNGQSTTTRLPVKPFNAARLNLKIDVARSNDFFWALGSSRSARIEGVSAQIDSVVAPASGSTASVKAGTEVYSASGTRLGVVELVKPAAAGKAAEIVVRPAEHKIQ